MKAIHLVGVFLLASSLAAAQTFDFPGARTEDGAALSSAMSGVAEQVIAVYEDGDRGRYLNQLFRLQLVAGRYTEAGATIRSLRDLRRTSDPAGAAATFVQYEIYAQARARQAAAGLPFEEAFAQAFRDVQGRLDDRTSHQVLFSFGANLGLMEEDLRKALEGQKDKTQIALAEALDLIRKYQVHQVYENILPLTDALVAEDDGRRYIIQDDILIKTRDGALVAALVVRPRAAARPLPALLNFSIYADPVMKLNEARTSAARGYVGMAAYTRGKGRSPVPAVPYEHDGEDAYAVIDWISKQPWSDGRVGMFGGSYEGFTQWAAAKRLHPALKTIMPSVPVAPGIDVPMEGNVFLSFVYPWIPYVTNNKGLDEAGYNDAARWNTLNRAWYTTGKPYREIDTLDRQRNEIFRRWLDHPSYDAYWQRMIPYGEDFAKIDIPVLTTTGYYDGCLLSALYYVSEHYKYNPRAEHYLVVGPYDHIGAQRRSANVLQGYEIDPVASINIEELRYQWFDHVFRGGEKPALLKDKVNYQVMGANVWKHAPSLDRLSHGSLRFHLSAARSGDAYRLSREKPSGPSVIRQTVDFADRTDVDQEIPSAILGRTLDTRNGFASVSDPIAEPIEISGLFSGQLDFVTNKKDLDLSVALYEQTSAGEYFALSYYLGRASYARDRSRRQLLTPEEPQQLAFRSGRLTSRKTLPGSRLVVVLQINKQPDLQINYGTGKDVSDESIADAGTPLTIEWRGESFIEIPLGR